MNYHKILIAVDGSPLSIAAAEKGIALGQLLDAEIALTYVVDTALVVGTNETGMDPQTILAEYRNEGRTVLDKLSAEMPKKPLTFITEGSPHKNILTTAQEWNADLIVIGTHGRTGLKRLLMGSVAEHVLRHSKWPVLIVPETNA